ncbi:PEP-CTERM sorting domain-containing protein [Congregibacter brevis]|uniref:PEP-CTERM sorting domain-containing protein n=1 Tax=Congregibacter brevis TaxID=3081201 RepID=A0ABZ0IG33_9GAMM|nr:PEP-CTERM sorting domain-containing protein [Congregibacter sp. IMCC45268]
MIKKLIAVGAAAILGSAAQAGVIAYNDFSDVSGWQLNNRAAGANPNEENVLRLTDGLGQASSAFYKSTISLKNETSFSSAFDFQITRPMGISDIDGQGADGIVFVVQTASNKAGGTGGSIGYGGLGNSVGIEFDTWSNGMNRTYNDKDGNHVGINIDGSVKSVVQTNVKTRMNNSEIWSAWVDYDGKNDLLEVRLAEDGVRSSEALLSLKIDLEDILEGSDAYVGFTSGTGAAGGVHDILSLDFRDDFAPIRSSARISSAQVPVPGSLPLLGMGLCGLVAMRKKMRLD